MALTKVKLIADDAITSAMIDSTSTGVAFADLTVDTSTLVVDAVNNRVGIGTALPSYPLEVQSGGVGTVLRAGTSFISIDPTGSAAAPSLIFNGDSNTGIYRPTADTLGFSTGGSERMRIDSSGNAIFTKSGGAYLQLKDASAVRGAINVETSDGLVFTTGSSFTERMRIDSNGNVGIGATNPQRALDVVATADSIPAIRITRNGDSSQWMEIKAGGADASFISRTAAAHSQFQFISDVGGSQTTRMIIDQSGNVGIGTTSPSYKLEVNGNAEFLNNVNIKNNSYDDYQIAVDSVGFSVYNRTDAAYNMTISHTGNVGIGTTSPSQKLEVRDGDITTRDASNTNYAQLSRYTGLILKGNGSGSRGVKTPNTDALTLGTNNTERMRIDSSGNVGIGQTSIPSTVLLDLKEPGAGSDLIIGLTAGTGARAQIRSEAQSDNTSAELSFHTVTGSSTSERMRISSNGAIGISGTNYGTSGQVLTSNGSGSAPSWQTAGGGAWGTATFDISTITTSGTTVATTVNASTVSDKVCGIVRVTFAHANSIAYAHFAIYETSNLWFVTRVIVEDSNSSLDISASGNATNTITIKVSSSSPSSGYDGKAVVEAYPASMFGL